MIIPDKFKIKIEKEQSNDLVKMYDLLFDDLGCTWAGRCGHYAYGDRGVSDNQDGYIYSFIVGNKRVITADCSYGDSSFIEISWHGALPNAMVNIEKTETEQRT